ncbi:DUF6266 family protein [Pedobacter hiemivivus]|uniref:Uncharacterized protein n=1 Tax=Pedobacter hiemivivus TaxID=2530454 RepID=A0A4R0NAG6_9SPHI|nr:DUF6266 family protein [Pedobacter hiemivivus]TCC97241.1 hypothetical protein EZ444_10350 [Pedobacter hiemivivus]
MGKLSRGFLGGFQGQLGTAYGCFWRLMDLVKAMPRKVKRAPTEKQEKVQLRWSLMTSFLAMFSHIIKIGFKQAAVNGQSAMNAAVSYNLKNAITGVSPDYTLDFSKLMFSKGKLALPNKRAVVTENDAEVRFEWGLETTGNGPSKLTDLGTFIVYNPIKNQYVSLVGGIPRSALKYTMPMPLEFSQDSVECYMIFASEDGKMVSDSSYIGNIPIV